MLRNLPNILVHLVVHLVVHPLLIIEDDEVRDDVDVKDVEVKDVEVKDEVKQSVAYHAVWQYFTLIEQCPW